MIKFNLNVGQRWMMFMCVVVLCLVVGSVLAGGIMYGGATTARIRIATVVQDVVMFIVPAIVTAMIITRTPAQFLMVSTTPPRQVLLLVPLTLLAAIPVMNMFIEANKDLVLTESMSEPERWMRESEDAANAMVDLLINGGGVSSLIVALLIVGVMAGFSEELFFRGCIQRLIHTSGVGRHVAVWSAAVIFSVMHFQFFGFVPRVLLGAYFGYLLIWSGSLWVPVYAHIFNNVLAAWSMWSADRGVDVALESIGKGGGTEAWVSAGISVVAVAGLLFYTYLILVVKKKQAMQ